MRTPPVNLYEFGGFELDPAKRLLRRLDGTRVPLTPRVFDTLLYMVEHHDAVLDKERIMEAVWPDSIVEENNLAQAISRLRQIFGETLGSHSYIVTVPGRGYRFVAEVKERTASSVDTVATTTPAADRAVAASPAADTAATTEFADSPTHRFADSSTAALPPKTGWLWAAAFLAIAILSFAALLFVRHRSSPAGVRVSGPSVSPGRVLSPAAPILEKSVAVLPFENRSEEKANAFFADGVQDEILTYLAKIADLKVISRSSVMHYKSGVERNLRRIGEELGVAHVLEGAVQRSGDRVRVNAQLIDARSDAHLWAQTYDRDLADVFAIQSEIAKAIADQLRAKLSPSEKSAIERPTTTDIAAFDLYTRAKNLFLTAFGSSTTKTDLLQAADLLNQAVAHDPSFFDAYCLLVPIQDGVYWGGYDHTPARLAKAEAAVQAASRLRPDAGETHLARAGNLYWGYLDYDGALAELEVARRTLPNDAQIFLLEGVIQRRQGRWEESTRNLERAIELDPRSVQTLQQTAQSYQILRRYAEERSVLARVLALEPNDPVMKVQDAVVELNSKADSRPLRRMIDSVQATNPTAMPSVAANWLICALAERDGPAAENALIAFGENPVTFGVGESAFFNRPFVEGVIARMAKDVGKAQAAFIVARAEQEKIMQAQRNYARALCALGLIDAGLGRKEEALREGRRAVELVPVDRDALDGICMVKYLAMIAAWVGDKDLACEQLAIAISRPGFLSYGELKLLPVWDPLREEPCFEKLVAALAPK